MPDLPIETSPETFDLAAWQAMVGPRNQAYYLPRFERTARGEGGAHWHWPAFLITWYWLVYRKMWAWALLYMVLPFLLLLPFGLLTALLGPHRAADAVPMLYLAALYVAPPLLANGAYYRHCRKLMAAQRARGGSREQYLAQLEARGGTSNVVVAVVGALLLVSMIGMLAAIALPAYQDYVKRARGSQTVQKPLRSIAPRVVTRLGPARRTLPSAALPDIALAQPAGMQQPLTRRGVGQQA